MDLHDNKEVIRRLHAAVAAGDQAAAAALCLPTVVANGWAVEGVAYVGRLVGTSPAGRARRTVEDLLADGDRVTARTTLHYAPPLELAGAAPLAVEMITIYRLEDGRIAEAWCRWDTLGAMIALAAWGLPDGALPPVVH